MQVKDISLSSLYQLAKKCCQAQQTSQQYHSPSQHHDDQAGAPDNHKVYLW